MKKVILSAFTATSLLLSSAPVFAGPLTISLGIPLEQTFTEKNESGSKIETITGSDKGKKDDVGGNVMGLGIGFNF